MRTQTLALLYLILLSFSTFAQKVNVALLPDAKAVKESGYNIKEVIDLRINKSKIGDVYDTQANLQSVDFQGKLDQTVLQFFRQAIKNPISSQQNIQVRLYNLSLNERVSQKNKLHEGEVHLELGFFKQGSAEPVHLVDYTGSIQYRRSPNRMDMINNVVNRIFWNATEYFDTWMNMQVMANRHLATEVKLEIIDRAKPSHKDTVYYDVKRPLVWMDFADKPRGRSNFNASIFTSFAIQGKSTVVDGKIFQTLEVDIYMLPDQSWVKSPSDYALNHEQRHFDLVRIIVDRFKANLQAIELDPEMFEATLNDAYFDAYREMNRIQEIYDKETKHGLNVEAQEKWNRIIDEALAGKWSAIDQFLDTK